METGAGLEQLQSVLGPTVVVYFIVMYAVAILASRRIHNVEDYAVAGRRLPVSLAAATLLATWVGAATVLIIPDEIRKEGLSAAAMDPLGAGFCLLLAGWFVAGPMWREKLLTVPDLFRRKFGRLAELMCALIMVPSYFGWVAAQFVALAGMANLFFGMEFGVALIGVAVLGTGYTLLGGMWSVTLTDAIQLAALLLGLIVMLFVTVGALGGVTAAWERVAEATAPEMRIMVPTESRRELFGWLSLFAVGALGNLPGQDLMQRVFSSKSESVARRSCFLAGIGYLTFGAIPVFLALAANVLVPDSVDGALLPAMARLFLHPVVAVVFVVAVLSAVLSTVDSAILAPATVLAQNVVPGASRGTARALWFNRAGVVAVAAASLGLAWAGQSAWSLLEDAYSLTLVGLLVPMLFGLFTRPKSAVPALASMVAGAGLWLVHYVADWEMFLEPLPTGLGSWFPASAGCTLASLAAYTGASAMFRGKRSG